MTDGIKSWLSKFGLSQYWSIFDQNKIGLDVLRLLTDQDLRELEIPLGDRKRILRAAEAMSSENRRKETGAELRQLTVLFCDIVNYTQLSNRVDAETLNRIMGSFEQCCEAAVNKFGGKIARYMGDAALIYLGYPQASENDPERAVRTGLEIIQAVRQLSPGSDISLDTRVGIATGSVVVGDLIGEGVSRERRAAGNTVNLAARLESLAEPNTVLISDVTKRLVGELFNYSDLGEHSLKGFEHKPPVHVWRVDGEADVQCRFEATRGGQELRPLLGREAETDTLMTRWARVCEGSGQAVTVIGDPGIGKSHLIQSLRASVRQTSDDILHYYCAPHQQKTALFPVIVHLLRRCGIKRSDSPTVKIRKIEKMVSLFSDNLAELVPLYANLLSVPANSVYPELNLSPRVQKERILNALSQQLVASTKAQPTLVIFEDLHWMDPTSLELLELIMQGLDNTPMLLVLTARPEFHSSWSGSSNTISMHLERLGPENVVHLIEQVTGGKRLPEAVVKKILEKTDGVPLFVEELTKTLLESELLEETEDAYLLHGELPDHAVPSTLHDSLMARLDRQGPGKKIAQIGAAIGRTFSREFIARICAFDSVELSHALDGLTRARLVYRRGEGDEAVYVFKHALIQDAAYSSLLMEKRRELHNTIADALQLYYPDVCKNHPEMLAHHYTHAHEYISAITFRERAARKSTDRAAHEEAQTHIHQALELLSKIPADDTRLQLELDLQVVRGISLESTLGYGAREVEEVYERAREICNQLSYKAELVPVLLGLYVFNLVRGEYLRAQALATRCVALSKEANRLDYLIESYSALGYIQGHVGDLSASVITLKEAIKMYESRANSEEFSNITAQDPCVAAYSFLALNLWLQGQVDESEQALKKAFDLSAQLDFPMNFAVVHTHAAEYYHMRGDYQQALDHAGLGIRFAEENGYDSWHLCSLMHTGITMGTEIPSADGIAMAKQGLALLQGAGAAVNMSYFKGRTAWCLHVDHQYDEAQALLGEAFADCKKSKDFMHAGLLYQLRGDMLCTGPKIDTEGAHRNFRKSLEVARSQGARIPELRALVRLQELYKEFASGTDESNALEKLLGHFSTTLALPDIMRARAVLLNNKTIDRLVVK